MLQAIFVGRLAALGAILNHSPSPSSSIANCVAVSRKVPDWIGGQTKRPSSSHLYLSQKCSLYHRR